jgi:hypothetical protein
VKTREKIKQNRTNSQCYESKRGTTREVEGEGEMGRVEGRKKE